MKKQSVRRNRLTGEPRKWTCFNNRAIDAKLEEAEMWHYLSRLAKAKGEVFAVETLPMETLRRLVEQDRHTLEMFERFLNARLPLTEAEMKYCKAEAIRPQDFIRRLRRA